jgi:hypothetical protein
MASAVLYVSTGSGMDMECAVCHQPIGDEQRWFRIREDYVHLSWYEKYLGLASVRQKESDTHGTQS